MAMIFIPGLKPRHTKGAVGYGRTRTRSRLVAGSAYSGSATPSNIVPYEPLKGDGGKKARAEREARAKDVADALHFHRDSPNSAREKLAEARAAASSVKLDD